MVVTWAERNQRYAEARLQKADKAAAIVAKNAAHDYSKESARLQKQIVAAQARKFDPSITSDRFEQTWLQLKGQLDENYQQDFITRTKKETGVNPNADIVSRTMKRRSSSFDYYDSLLNSASELGIEYDKDKGYESYLAEKLKRETPVQDEKSSILGMLKNFGKGVVSTSVGATLLAKDTLVGGNSYDNYFYKGEKVNRGFKDKALDLLFDQGAWMDVCMGALAFVPPVAAVMGAGAFFLRGGIKGVSKAGLKSMTKKGLKQGLISEATATSFKEIAKLEGEAFTKALLKNEKTISNLFKNPRKLRSKKATFINAIGDTLDVPGLYTVGHFIDKAGGGLKYAPDPYNIVTRVGLAAAGEFVPVFTNHVTRAADELAGYTAKHLQLGLVEKEKQKFIEQHGIDPNNASGALKKSWEQHINYKIRNAGFLTTLNGYEPEKDEHLSRFIHGAIDGTLNFALMGGIMKGTKRGAIKGWDKTFGIKDEASQHFLNQIISGEETTEKFFSNVKVVKALAEAQKGLESKWQEITAQMVEGDRLVLVSKRMEMKEQFEKGNHKESAKIFQSLVGDLSKSGEYQKENIEGLKEIETKMHKFGDYIYKQNSSLSRLAHFKMGLAQLVFSSKQVGDLAEVFVKGDGVKDMVKAAHETTKSQIDITEKMATVFKSFKVTGKQMVDLFKTGKSLPGLIDERLNVLLKGKFTEEQKVEIKESIGQRLHTRILEIGLATSKFENKDLAKVINDILSDSFSTALIKEVKVKGLEKATVNERLDSILKSSNVALVKLEKSLTKDIGQATKILEQKTLQLRAVNDVYAKIVAQQKQSVGTDELLAPLDAILTDTSIKNSDIAREATPNQTIAAGKEVRKFYENIIKNSKLNSELAKAEIVNLQVEMDRLKKLELESKNVTKEMEDVQFQLDKLENIDQGKHFEASAELRKAADRSWEKIEDAINNKKLAYVEKYYHLNVGNGVLNTKVSGIVGEIGANNAYEVIAVLKKQLVGKKGKEAVEAKAELESLTKYAKEWTLTREKTIQIAKKIDIREGLSDKQKVRAYGKLLELYLTQGHFYSAKSAHEQIKQFFKKRNSLTAAYSWNRSLNKQKFLSIAIEPGKIGEAPKEIKLGSVSEYKINTLGKREQHWVPISEAHTRLTANGFNVVSLDVGRPEKLIGKQQEGADVENILREINLEHVVGEKSWSKEGEKSYDFFNDIENRLKEEGVIVLPNFNSDGLSKFQAVIPVVYENGKTVVRKWKNDAEYKTMQNRAIELAHNLKEGEFEKMDDKQLQALSKYGKLQVATDVSMTPFSKFDSTERVAIFDKRPTDEVAHLVFRDPPTKAGGNPLNDGLTLVAPWYLDQTNKVIGAEAENTHGKTHITLSDGSRIKHAGTVLQPFHFGFPRVVEAIKANSENLKGTRFYQLLHANLTSPLAQKSLYDEFLKTKPFDAFSSETTVKMNKSVKPNDIIFLKPEQIKVKNEQSGDKIKQGNISSQQSNRINAMNTKTLPLANAYHEGMANLQIKRLAAILPAIKRVMKGESFDIGEITKEFNIHLDPTQKILNGGNFTSSSNMLKTILTSVLRGVPGKIQKYHTQPMTKNVQDEANNILKKKYEDTFTENNFIVVEHTKELETLRDKHGGRMNLNRNPCDSAGSIAMPFVIFKSELESLKKSSIKSKTLITQHVAGIVKADFDGDPVSISIDAEFNKLNDLRSKLSDEYQRIGLGENVDAEAKTTGLTEAQSASMSNFEKLTYFSVKELKAKKDINSVFGTAKVLNILASIQDKSGGNPFLKDPLGGAKELDKIISIVSQRVMDKGGSTKDFAEKVNDLLADGISVSDSAQINLKLWGNNLSQNKKTAGKILNDIKVKIKNNLKDPAKAVAAGSIDITQVKVNLDAVELSIAYRGKKVMSLQRNESETIDAVNHKVFDFNLGKATFNLSSGGEDSSKIIVYRASRIVEAIKGMLQPQSFKAGGGQKDIYSFLAQLKSDERVEARKLSKAENKEKFFEGNHEYKNRSVDFYFKTLEQELKNNGAEMKNSNFKLTEKLLELADGGAFDFLSKQDILTGTNPTTTASRAVRSDLGSTAHPKWYEYKGVKEEDMTPQQEIAYRLSEASKKSTSKIERQDAIIKILEIKKSLCSAEKSDMENFILSTKGITGTTNDLLSTKSKELYQIMVEKTMIANERNTNVPADLRRYSELLVEGNKTEIAEERKSVIEKLEHTAKQTVEKDLKLQNDIKECIDDPDVAKSFMDFVTIMKDSGLDATIKDNPTYEIFKEIGGRLIDSHAGILRDSFKTVKDTNIDANSDLDVDTGKLRTQKNQMANGLNRETDNLEKKRQVRNIIRTVADNSLDAQGRQQEIAKILTIDAMGAMDTMLKNAQDLVIDSSDLDASNLKLQKKIDKHLYKTSQEISGFDTTKAVYDFYTKLYKSINVGIAVGRAVSESIQTKFVAIVNNISNGKFRMTDSIKFQEAVSAAVKGGEAPKAGKFSSKFDDHQKRASLTKIDKEEVNKWLQALREKTSEITNKLAIYKYPVAKVEQKFFEDEFMTKTWDQYNRMIGQGEDGSILFKQKLTANEINKRNKIMYKIKRDAAKKTNESFFGDYGTHPLIVQKMEDVMPFSNFLFTGMKMINRYPKSILAASSLLTSMQNQFGEEIFALDEEGNRLDVGKRWGFPLLGFMGFGNVALNVQRMLQISPADLGGQAYPLVGYLQGNHDWRIRKYYKDVANGKENAFGWLMASSISPVFEHLKEFATTGHPSALVDGLGYYATGFVMKDRTQSDMIGKYFNGDYEEMLEYGDMQFKEFSDNKMFADNPPTKKSIQALVEAEELGLLGDKQNPYDKVMRAMSMADLSHLSEEDQTRERLVIKNGVDCILGKKIYGNNFDNEWLDKVKKFSESKNYKEFGKVNKAYAKTIDHYVKYHTYYKTLYEASSLAYSDKSTLEEKAEGYLTLTALRYKFEGEDDVLSHISNLNQKKSMIKSGKLDTLAYDLVDNVPQLTSNYEAALDRKGVLVEMYTKGVAKAEAAGQMKMIFFSLAENSVNKKDQNEYWARFNEQQAIQEGQEAMLRDLITTDKDTFINKHGKDIDPTLGELYFLKHENRKDPKPKKLSYSQRLQYGNIWEKGIKEDKIKLLNSKLDKLRKLTPNEKAFYVSTGTSPTSLYYNLRKQLKAETITPEQAQGIIEGNQFGNINL